MRYYIERSRRPYLSQSQSSVYYSLPIAYYLNRVKLGQCLQCGQKTLVYKAIAVHANAKHLSMQPEQIGLWCRKCILGYGHTLEPLEARNDKEAIKKFNAIVIADKL